MRALKTVHDKIAKQTQFMHRARWGAVWRAVMAVLVGRQLWLTGMGRARPGPSSQKHGIKAIDRLLGNPRLHAEVSPVYRALASLLLRPGATAIVLVDTMEIKHKVVSFSASLAHDGRSFPIFSMIVDKVRPNAAECCKFLRELKKVLPRQSAPVVVTDGGFGAAWFRELDRLGWHYVGRVRGQVHLFYESRWTTCPELHRRATRRAKNLGELRFPKQDPSSRRVVLSKLPRSRHRRRRTRRGPDNDTNYKHYRKNAHEPLVLTTSLTSTPQAIVDIYKLRMQIEETFRDWKCHRWGWSLRHCGTRNTTRLDVLLLIAAIAMFAQMLVGMIGELLGVQHRFQANTVRNRRVLSLFVLGGFLIRTTDALLRNRAIVSVALRKLRDDLKQLQPLET